MLVQGEALGARWGVLAGQKRGKHLGGKLTRTQRKNDCWLRMKFGYRTTSAGWGANDLPSLREVKAMENRELWEKPKAKTESARQRIPF